MWGFAFVVGLYPAGLLEGSGLTWPSGASVSKSPSCHGSHGHLLLALPLSLYTCLGISWVLKLWCEFTTGGSCVSSLCHAANSDSKAPSEKTESVCLAAPCVFFVLLMLCDVWVSDVREKQKQCWGHCLRNFTLNAFPCKCGWERSFLQTSLPFWCLSCSFARSLMLSLSLAFKLRASSL